MSNLAISPIVTSNLVVFHPEVRGKGSLSSEDAFTIGSLFYLSKLHETLLDTWGAFRENQAEVHDDNRNASRTRLLDNDGREEVSKNRFHFASYADDDTRHLNLPI